MYLLLKTSVKVLLIFMSLYSGIISAQNYQAVKTDASYYFYDSLSMGIIAERIDSIALAGNETHYYAMRQIRQTDYSCFIPDGASWLGDVVIEKPNGIFQFVLYPFSPSDSADVFTIKSNATVGESWHFYNYHTINDYVEAKATQIVPGNFIGISDSVKTITLQRKDASGQNISDPVNGQKILLSKNYGLIRLPKFDEFICNNSFYDLVGKDNPDTGITNVSTLQIYNFEPGDELHTVYHNKPYSPPNTETTISTIFKVISKTTDSVNNSVTYQFEHCSSAVYRLSDSTTNYVHSFDSIVQTYSPSNTPELETLPLETTALSSLYESITYTKMGFMEDNSHMPIYNIPYKSMQSGAIWTVYDNCYIPMIYCGCLYNDYYLKGLGGPYYYCEDFGWSPTYYLLKYYKKGSETWGMPLDCDSLLQVSITKCGQNLLLNIYPNPTSGIITVLCPTNLQFPCRLEFFDISGRKVIEFTITMNTASVDLSNLPYGLFTYKLTSPDGNVFHGKIIRR